MAAGNGKDVPFYRRLPLSKAIDGDFVLRKAHIKGAREAFDPGYAAAMAEKHPLGIAFRFL